MASEHYDDLVWDYLYGLLETTEAEALRAHLPACSACQAALAEAERQQRMLARAAQVIKEVPAFTAPLEDREPVSVPLVHEPAQVLPGVVPAGQRPGRAFRRRTWFACGMAAALLAAAFGLNQIYRERLSVHEAEITDVRKSVQAVDGRFAALQAKVVSEQQEKAQRLEENIPPQLLVLAPAEVIPQTASTLHVVTRDRTGKLRAAEVTTKVLEENTGKVLYQRTERIHGEANVKLPGVAGRLLVEAKAGKADAKVEQTIRLAQPVYASHLVLDKATYFVGDVLFFRTLTLDRFSLKPPGKSLPLRFALVDASGRTVKTLPGQTGQGGIGGGELALTPDIMSGPYTLTVTAGPGIQATAVIPQKRNLEIVRNETPQIEFDRNQYRAGDKIGFNFRGGGQAGNNSYANKQVTINLNADGRPVPQQSNTPPAPPANNASLPLETRLDNSGNLNNFQLQLPAQIKNSAEIIIDLKDGQKDNKLVQAIPVVPSAKMIDFFPEGGDLVAGVPNRVYYRVRSLQGETVEPEGHVIVLASKEVLHDSARKQGLGSFVFTPDPKETYSARISGPGGVTEIHNPFHKLDIKTQGLVLHAPGSVSRHGEPLVLVLRNQGPARRYLLQTTCRGQIVHQQYVDLSPGTREIKLEPALDAAGILRVTALEVADDRLGPVAERLLYRLPSKRLEVACETDKGTGPYLAGSNVVMTVKVRDESKKKAGPAWLLAAVVDEKYQPEKREPSLAAHFYLAGELDDNLEHANLLLSDTPQASQALDLFLGTQGWRRFVRGQVPTLVAMNEKGAADAVKETVAASSGFFSRQNTSTQELQNVYQTALQKEVSELIDRANRERSELLDQKDVHLQMLDRAVQGLSQLQQAPLEIFRLAFGVLALGLLIVGGAFLVAGLIRLLRRRDESPTACFAGAFSCMFACLIVYLVAGRVPHTEVALASPRAALRSTPWPEFTAANIESTALAAQKPPASDLALVSPPQGYFMAQASAQREEQKRTGGSAPVQMAKADGMAKRGESMVARAQTYGANQYQNNQYQTNAQDGPQRQVKEQSNDEMKRRFQEAQAKAAPQGQTAQQAGGPLTKAKKVEAAAAMKMTPSMPAKVEERKGLGDDKSASTMVLREYAHRSSHFPGRVDLQDTLLWHPNLPTVDGQARVSFDLSQNQTSYRILIFANSPSGSLGFYEGSLDVRK